ncbi:hypothetical protein HU200_033306 [Digitaria exilis]|uniref:Prolamin-like domain-containing protein n=1 Tax=Digitaria exilis TaxID=1010633 RepID=A0A835ENN8_9POAL|nr:hypothetical protein HU200_033306 [Digitaria exilis]
MDCYEYISKNARNIVVPKPWGKCFKAVREVPNKDMECIKRLVSVGERMRYNPTRILNLANLC